MDDTSTPTYERVLSVFENPPTGEPFEPAAVALLVRLQRAAREHYARMLDEMLAAEHPGNVPLEPMRGAQMLHRRIANALAQAALRRIPRPQLIEDQVRVAELALGSLRARADEIKWHAFEQTTMPRASWRQTHALVQAVESIGMERRALIGQATCMDAFAHCVLLATLNVGILSAPQMELAHRWLCVSALDMRVEPFFDPDAHWYQLDLAGETGPQRVSPAAETSSTMRFFAVCTLGAKLALARTKLYAGQVSVGVAPSPNVALNFGAFLDLAERLWSPDWRRASLRAEREKAAGEAIEVVIGLEHALAALKDGAQPETAQATRKWSLRDRSSSGLGVFVSMDDASGAPLGGIIAFRSTGSEQWELGCIVRRIRAAEEDLWCVGIRRLSAAPVAIELTRCATGSRPGLAAQARLDAVYAPIIADSGRIDGLVIPARAFGTSSEFILPTEGGAFRIRANRVIDRGSQWVRFGFEVLGKQATVAPRTATA